MIDAGLAATGTRLEIATALAQAAIPRPATFIAMSEATALDAASKLGYPVTLFPQDAGATATALLDHDTAEAVIEHRVVLGAHGEAIMLMQAGVPNASELGRHHVIDGAVVAVEGELTGAAAQEIAVAAADALGATVVTVDIARIDGELVVWDVVAVADFRHAMTVGERSVGEAIAALAGAKASVSVAPRSSVGAGLVQQGWEVQVRNGVIGISLTA